MSPNGTKFDVRILFLVVPLMLGTGCLTSSCLGAEAPAAAPAEAKPAEPAPAAPATAEKPAEPAPAAPAPAEKPAEPAPAPAEKPAEAPKKLTDPRLRFSFRAQLWEEVLQWFAEQAGLSLVMDHPPQGSFNYIDDKEYSPIEGIDLLNKVLMTKHFTLIRNEQMLMVVDLSEGIPQGIVPVVTLEDLKERGNFELVSVRFPLGKRDVAIVTQEITALLGPNGKAVSLPATKQLLVTDTAGIMAAIGAVIKSIPEPAPPKAPPKPKDPVPPEKPVIQVHEIKTTDPAAAIEVLKQLFAGEAFVLDEPNRRFTVNTIPSRQAEIKKTLETIDLDSPEGKARTTEVYAIEIGPPTGEPPGRRGRGLRRYYPGAVEGDPAAPLIGILKNAVPQAQINYDQAGKQLVAWATSEEQTKLKETLDKIVGGDSLEWTPHVGAYPLEKLDPESTRTMFQTLLPDAQVSLDTKSRVLVALAIPADHDAISTTLEQMRKAESGEQALVLKTYPVAMDMTTAITEALTNLVPDAKVTVDTENKRLVAIAAKAEHEVIQKTIDQLEARGTDRQNMFVVYPVKSAEPASVLELLNNLYPRLKIVLDPKGNSLMVWARAEEHASIKSTLEQLQPPRAGPDAPVLKLHPVKEELPADVMTLLATQVPRATITADTKNRRLMVIASPADQDLIATTIQQVEEAGPTAPELRFIELKKELPSSVMSLLTTKAPGATITPDMANKRLMVIASPADHEVIAAFVKQATAAGPASAHPTGPELRFIPLEEQLPESVMSLLKTKAPRATITLDAANKRLMVIGSPADQKVIGTLIQQATAAGPTAPELRFIPLEEELPASVMSLLTTKAPGATITPDAANKRLMVIASPADHEVIATLVQQATSGGTTMPELRFVPLEEPLPADVMNLLATKAPGATITPDTVNKRLMVVATPADHEAIATLIQQATSGGTTMPELRFVPLEEPLPSSVMSLLASKAPGATITPDEPNKRLMVIATPADHEAIATLVKQATAAGPTAPKMQFVSLEEKLPPSVLGVIQTLVPNATITVDNDGKTLMVVASPTDFEKVKETISQAMESLGPEEENSLAVYPVTPALRARAQAVLASITAELPGIQILPDTDTGSISIWAKPSQHKVIDGVFEQLKQEVSARDKYTLVAYAMKSADAASVMEMLTKLFPNTQIVIEAKTNRLLVWTRPDEHESIKAALDEIELSSAPDELRRFKAFSIKGAVGLNPTSQAAASAAIIEQLQTLAPNAKLTMDAKGGKLLAFGTPSELKVIGMAVAELGYTESPSDRHPMVKLYDLGEADPTSTMTLLQGLVPGAEIILDSTGKRLIVWATQDDHEAVRKTLDMLQTDTPGPNDPQIMFYLMDEAPPAALVTGLQSLVPDAQVTYDAEGKTLMVVAKPADQKVIEQAVKEMGANLPAKEKNTLMVYPATPDQRKRFEATLEVIKTDMPDIKIVTDDGTGVKVWAKPSEHEIVGEVLQQLRLEISGEGKRSFQVYPIQSGSSQGSTVLLTGLQEIVPSAKLMIEPDGRKLSAWATAAEHEMIAEAVGKLDATAREKMSRFEAYTVKGALVRDYYGRRVQTPYFVEGLQALAPDARMTVDVDSSQLVVWGTPEDHEVISAAVAKLSSGDTAQNRPTLVVYQLTTANPNTILTALQQLVPEAQVSADTQSGSIVALAIPADQEAIRATLEKLQPAADGTSRRELLIYPFTEPLPTGVVEGLQALIPNAKVTLDADGKHLTVVASPAEHALVKESIDKLEQAASMKEKPYFEAYTIKGIGGPAGASRYSSVSTLMSSLSPLVPDATLSVDQATGKLIAWATAKDHAKVKAAIDKLVADGTPENIRVVEVHAITRSDPASTMTILQSMVPEAQLSIETTSGNLIALAVPADQETIRKTLEQLQPTEPDENTPQIVVYPFTERPPASVATSLQLLAPKSQISVDADGKHLTIVATPADHVRIKESIDKLEHADSMKEKPYFKAYAVKGIGGPAGTSRYSSVSALLPSLSPLVPNATLSVDPQTGKLIAWATTKDHANLDTAIGQLVGDDTPENTPVVEIHAITRADPTSTMTLLQSVVPEAQLSIETTSGNLIALAVPADQETIRKTLEQLQPAEPDENTPQIVLYPFTERPPASVVTGLQALAPKAQITADADGKHLMVVATPADHVRIKASIDKLEHADSMKEKPYFKGYAVKGIGGPAGTSRYTSVSAILPSLSPLLPDATLSVDSQTGKLIAWATAKDHEKLEAAIGQLVGDDTPENTRVVEIHAITRSDPTSAMTLLQSVVPEAQLSIETTSGNLIALAVPADQETIRKTLEQLQPTEPGPNTPQIVVYPFTERPPASVATSLQLLAPKSQISVDADGKHLTIVATPADHVRIKASIDKLEQADSMKDKPYFEAYAITGIGGPAGYTRSAIVSALLPTLSPLVPSATLTVDSQTGKLIAWATAKDHAKVKAAIDKLVGDGTPENTRVVEIYAITRSDPTSAMTLLQSLVPDAQLSVDPTTGNLIALAVPADQETIRKTLEQLQPTEPGPNTPQIVVYPFTERPPASVATSLQLLAPKSQISVDADGKHLTIVATPADHVRIKASIDKLEQADSMKDKPYFEAYAITGIGGPAGYTRSAIVSALLPTLSPLVPSATLTVDSQTGKLIAWATAKDHAKVKAAIDKLVGDGTPENTRVVEIYAITRSDPTSAMTLLQSLVPDAQLSVDPTTGNLIALAVPADQETIRKTLEQLQPTEPGPNTPQIVLYPFTERPPASVVTGLQTLAPKAQITADADGKHLMVVATPADHVRIKASIDKLEHADSMKDKPYFEAYAITGIGGPAGYSRYAIVSALLPTLSPLVPNATLTVDSQTGKLIAWATAKDHAKVKAAIDKLVGDGTPENTRVVEIHAITRSDPTSAMTLLQSLVPDAQLSVETTSGNLIALAVPADQETIRKTLEQLQPTEPGPNTPELRFYQLSKPAPPTLIPGLSELVPKAQLTLGPKAQRLMVVATVADHAVVKANLAKIDAAAHMEEQNTLKVHAVTLAERRRFNTLLPTIMTDLPGIQVITDAEPGELSIWARPSQHETIGKILEELKRKVPPEQKYKLVGYAVKSSDVTSVMTVLQDLFPDTKFTADARARRIFAYSTPAQHADIAAAMKEMEGDVSATGEEKFVSHPVPATISSTVITVLNELLPGVTMYPDTSTGSIIAWGRDSEHELIAKTINQLQVEPDSKFKPYLMVYPPGDSDVTTLSTLLNTLVPQATVVPDTTNRTLSVFATAKDHKTVQSAINSVSATATGTGERTVKTYSLENQTAASATVLLRSIVPQAECSTGVDTHQLVVSAFAQDHRKIKKALDQLEAAGPPDTLPILKMYRLKSTTANSASIGMQPIVPAAIFSTGTDPYELIAWARPADHKKIQRVVDELSKEPPPETVATFKVYGLDNITYATATSILTLSVPQAQISAGVDTHQLIAWARPDDHELIQSTLKQIDVKGPDDKIAKAKMYEVDTGNSTKDYYIAIYLQSAVPTATFAQGMDSTQLVAWARPADHEKITNLLEELIPPGSKSTLVTYSLTAITAAEATGIVSPIIPNIQVNAGTNPHQLLAWATPKEHEKLKGLLEGIDKKADAKVEPTTQTYPLEHITATVATQILTLTMPQVRFNTGADPKQLIAVARPIDHEAVKAALDKLDVESPYNQTATMKVYSLEPAYTGAGYYQMQLIQSMVPTATITQGRDYTQMVALASPKDHTRIEELVEELADDVPPEKASRAVVYTLEEVSPSVATQIVQLAVPVAQLSPTDDPSQLVAWAKPRDHKKIEEVLQQIDVEGAEDKAAKVVVYTLASDNSTRNYGALMFLQQAITGATISMGADYSQIIARARPKDHEQIVEILAEFDKEPPAEKAIATEVYTLDVVTSSTAMQVLGSVVPEAKLTPGQETSQLIAHARPLDHVKIRETLLKIDVETTDATTMVIYQLASSSPQRNYYTYLTFLQQEIPGATYSLGATDPSQLIVSARPKDHEKISKIIQQLEKEAPPELKPGLVTYSLEHITAADAMRLLTGIVPEAELSAGGNDRQFIAWATPTGHEKLAGFIADLDKAEAAESKPTTVVYTLEKIAASTAQQILTVSLPGVTFQQGSDARQLITVARPIDHQLIQSTIDRIDVESPFEQESTVVTYTLQTSNSSVANYQMQFMQGVVPEASFTLGSDIGQMVVRARPADHSKIEELIEQLSKDLPLEKQPKAVVYTLKEISAGSATQLLGQAVPEAQLSTTDDTGQLVVWATPKYHEKVVTVLEQIDVESMGTTMVIYQLASSSPRRNYYTYLMFLQQEIPGANYSLGAADPSQLIVSARPKDHEKIAKIIQELEKEAPPELKPGLVTYSLEHITAADAMRLLTGIVPEAELSAGGNDRQFIAWATPTGHEKLAGFIADLDKAEAAESKPTTVVYTLEKIAASTAQQILTVSLPGVTFQQGSDARQLITVARPIDHQLIQSTIDRIDVESPFEQESTVVTYTLQTSNSSVANYQMQFMQGVVPEASFTLGSDIGQMVVRARPADHSKIEELIEQLSKDLPLEKQPKAVVYTLKEISAGSATQLLGQAVPEAQLSTTDDTGQLVVWATPKYHEKVVTVLEQIDVAIPEDKMLQVATYALKETTAAVATQILQQAIPEAMCSVGADPKQLIVRARPKDHELVKSVLDTIDVEGPSEAEGKMVLYELEDLDYLARNYLMQMLQNAIPQAVYSVSQSEDEMLVWGRQKDHDKIKQVIDQMAESPERIPQAIVYSLEEITASIAMQILGRAYPDLDMIQGADPQLLIVWAKEKDHAKVKATLAQIDVEAPEGAAATVKVYDMEGFSERSVRHMLFLLRDAVANIRYVQGRDPTQVVIWATPKDHREISEIIDQLAETPETAHQAEIYNLKGMRAASAIQLLQTAVPDANYAPGVDAYQVIAWARPDDHEKILAAVNKLSEEESAETAAKMHVYALETLDAGEAMRLLQTVVPEAQFGFGANARQLIAWARPADHEKIEATITEMAKEEPAETAPRFKVYTVEATGAGDAISVIQAAVPEAEFSVGADSRQLIAFARPSEHEKIEAALEQLATRGPEESLPTIKVYSLETAGAQNALQVLAQALPEAQFTLGDDPSKLIARAYPEDHAVIKAAVEEIESDSWLEGNRQMSVYSVRREDVDTLMQLLGPVIRQHAQFVTDDERESLIVWATKKYHEAIQNVIDEFIEKLPEPVEPEVVVYRFERSDPSSAYTALRSLVPEAEISLDPVSRNLVISALPEDHTRIRATIAEIEREDAGGQAPELRIYHLRTADPGNLLTVISNLFGAERDVQLSLDADNDSLIVHAAPRHHERIAELIAEVEKGALVDSSVRMQLHSLKNVDTYSSLGILRDALDKMGAKADLSTDYTRNALVAIARPEHQEKIAELLDELRGEERFLEIFQLDYVELRSAERAVSQLFFEESYESAPQMEADYETQQLFVRATADQLEEIRHLLIRLGEIGLTSISGTGKARLRVIPFEGDLQSIVEELKQVWPRLRSNEMRIVAPTDLAPVSEAKPEAKPAMPAEKPKAEAKPVPVEKPKPKAEAKTSEKPKAEAKPAAAKKPKPAEKPKAEPKPAKPAATEPAEKSESKKDEKKPEAAQGAAGPEGESGRLGVAGPKDTDAESKPGAPVTLMVGKDSLTIASDDLDALDELESLLQALLQRAASPLGGRNYSVFQLRNTSAASVSQTLQNMFREKITRSTRRRNGNQYRYPYGGRPTPLVIVPDERLNTVFVQGSRSDRKLIGSMIDMLDTDEVPETSAARKPRLIPIENAKASVVEQTIRDVFSSQLASGASKAGGAAFAPRLAVDDTTNTLILTAPAPLIDEITELAETLDKKAGDHPAERLRIIRLKKANVTRVEEALNSIIRGRR